MRIIIKLIAVFLLFVSCEKDEAVPEAPPKNYVTIKIEYLGEGGMYTDDIATVPHGLSLGSNGPYEFDANRSYTIQYKPSNSWAAPIKLEWTPSAPTFQYVIHCYVEGNMGHITASWE
jgi:hypothetical protein